MVPPRRDVDDPARRSSSADDKKANGDLSNSFKAFRVAGPLFGSGIQMAAAVVFFFYLGRWLDTKFGTAPWLMLTGALIGVGGGLYNFIRISIEVDDKKEEKDSTLS